MADLRLDPYVHGVLLRDLVGHDRRPASFLVYLWLLLEQQSRGRPVAISYAALAEEVGLSRSATQASVLWLLRRELLSVEREYVTATPVYTAHATWLRRSGTPKG